MTKKTLYFTIGNNPCDDAGDALLVAADLFLGMKPLTATSTAMYFNKVDGARDVSVLTFTHANGDGRAVMHAVGDAMLAEPRDGMIDIVDKVGGGILTTTTNLITSVAFTTL